MFTRYDENVNEPQTQHQISIFIAAGNIDF